MATMLYVSFESSMSGEGFGHPDRHEAGCRVAAIIAPALPGGHFRFGMQPCLFVKAGSGCHEFFSWRLA
jgi:hypothetical protein